MKSDKELLELAAKAAGMEPSEDGVIYAGFGSREWNPLIDDGDAFQLMVHLHMHNDLQEHLERFCDEAEFNADPFVATRRAIVIAAAKIGEGK